MSDVLAVAEHREGEPRDGSYRLITAGRELAAETGGALHLAVIGGDADRLAEDLARAGVDQIHTLCHEQAFNHDRYVEAIEAVVTDVEPQFVLAPNSVNGMDYAPAVATALDWPIVTDAIDIAYNGALTATREMYGSKVQTDVRVSEPEAVVTVRASEWDPTEAAGEPTITPIEMAETAAPGSRVLDIEETGAGDLDIAEAEFIVSVGRGIEEEENLELIERLAETTGATLAASRPIVDNGWLPSSRQVGQSGKTVEPDIYIAIGISGAVQHLAGMKQADTIIAINTDPDAPIFEVADYGINGDLFDVVPALIEEFGGTPP